MFEIVETIKKQDVPESKGRKNDGRYKKLFKAVATLMPSEALKVKCEKKSHAYGIQKALKKEFHHTSYRVTQRTEGNKIYAYIYKEDK